jgi:hypothetical protein
VGMISNTRTIKHLRDVVNMDSPPRRVHKRTLTQSDETGHSGRIRFRNNNGSPALRY